MTKELESKLRKEFSNVINRNSVENGSNTPDFILGQFLVDCLKGYQEATRTRDNWYDGKKSIVESGKDEKWQ